MQAIAAHHKPPLMHSIALAIFCILPLLLGLTRAGADVAICIIGALFILHCIKNQDWRWTARIEIRLLAALWLYMMASSALAENPYGTFKVALVWGRLLLFYAAATSWLLTSRRALEIVCGCGTAILLLLFIDTAWQYVTGISLSGNIPPESRITGPLKHPNIGNLILKTGLPMLGLLFFWLSSHGKTSLLWLANLFMLSLVALIFVSGERSITLLLFLAITVTATGCFLFQPQTRKTVALVICEILLIMATLSATQPVIKTRGEFLAKQMSNFWDTPYGQLYIGAYGLWKENPLFGIGAGQFTKICWPNMEKLQITYCDMHPHNIYLEWLADTGIIGLLLFVAAMSALVWRAIQFPLLRGSAWLPAIFACGTLAVLLFPVIVTQSVFSNWPGILFWYSLSLATCLTRIAKPKAEST